MESSIKIGIISGLLAVGIAGTALWAAISGNVAVSVVDPASSIKYYTVPGDATNGMYVNVRTLPTVTVISPNQANFLATVYQATGTNLHTVVDSGTVTANQGTSPWVVSGTVSVGTPTVNQGTSPWVIAGNKTNNSAVPGTNNIGTLPAIATAYRSVLTSGNQGSLSMDLNGNLRTHSLAESVMGDIVSQERSNQVEVLFSSAFDATVITNTTTSTGTATQSSGQAVYATGVGTTANASAVTVSNILYRPGHEAYFYFSAAWTTPTNANSTQRIGAMDAVFGSASNGFYMGYEGLSMQASIRQGGVDTHQTFNSDPLDGSANSAFTRNDVIEVVDFTKLNIFRIRWSWFGAAPVIWQILSPDGSWVTFHHYRNPNTQNIPSIAQPNLFLSLAVDKTSSNTTDLKMYTACWAGGTTDNGIKLTDTLTDNTLAKLTRSVMVGHSTVGGTYINVKVNPSGALAVDASDSTGLGITSLPSVTVVSMPTVTVNQGANWAILGVYSDDTYNHSNKVSVLGARSTEAVPSWGEDRQVPLSVDLTGAVRTTSALSTSITTSQVVVSNSATLIKASNTSRRSLIIRNHGSVAVYVGNSGVTTSIGMILNQYDALSFDKNTAAIYGITSSGTSTVSFVEE